MGAGGRTQGLTSVEDRTFTPSAPFECHWQCSECGYQVPPRPAATSPDRYRTAAEVGPTDQRPEGACPSCRRSDTWANLREGAVVEALIVQDETRQATRDSRKRGVTTMLAALAWVGATIGLTVGHGGWFFIPLGLGTAWMAAHVAFAEILAGRRERTALSWSHQRRHHGRVRATLAGPLSSPWQLRAPFSGRACLAYEIGVRHDADADAEPWTWTLLEQRVAQGVRVGDRELEQNPHLLVNRQLHVQELSPRARGELRKRGIDPTRPGYTLFETVLLAGDDAELEVRRRGLTLRA